MVEALVCGLEGGGEKSGYILGMCSDHSLVASYSGPNFFFVSFWCIKQFGAHFLFEYTNGSFGSDFLYNSIVEFFLSKFEASPCKIHVYYN